MYPKGFHGLPPLGGCAGVGSGSQAGSQALESGTYFATRMTLMLGAFAPEGQKAGLGL